VREAQEIAGLVAAGVVPCLAYLAIGLRLLTWTGVASRGAERLALAWVLGTGSASLAILLLRALDVPLPLLALAAVAVLAWLLPRRGAGPARSGAPSPGAAPWVRAVDIATGGVAALSFVVALGPETAWDGFEYHLPLVRAWTEGPVRALPGMIDAEFRAGVDLLFAPAVGAGWPDAAAAVSAGFALALAALVRAEASRRASPGAGALAGWFTLVVPLTLQLAPTTYVDLGVGAYGFLGLLGVDRWNRGAERRELLLSALYLGFAVNAKLSAAVLCPAALALALLGGRRPAVSVLARCAAVVALVTAPWFAKVAITTGNPFFPFLGGWLGTGPADAGFVELRKLRSLANYPVRRDAPGLLSYLASITFGRNPHVGGLLGPLPLALAPLALGRVGRATVVLTVTLATLVGLQFFFLPALRFGTPLWPFLGVAAAVGGRRLAASGPAARALLAAVLAFLAIHHTAAAAVRYLPRLPALRDPRAYERASFPDQDALRRMVARAEPVVAIPMGAVAWMPQPVYNLLFERNGELDFGPGTPPARALALLERRGVRSLVLDVRMPLPADGGIGHPIVDVWLRQGRAALAPELPPLPARAGRVWVLVRLLPGRRSQAR
jgi:hypothetical protein